MNELTSEGAAERILWSLGMNGKPHQVRLLLDLIDCGEAFTAPELVQRCGVPRGLVYPFLASLRVEESILPSSP